MMRWNIPHPITEKVSKAMMTASFTSWQQADIQVLVLALREIEPYRVAVFMRGCLVGACIGAVLMAAACYLYEVSP